jgi:hypothetical protein
VFCSLTIPIGLSSSRHLDVVDAGREVDAALSIPSLDAEDVVIPQSATWMINLSLNVAGVLYSEHGVFWGYRRWQGDTNRQPVPCISASTIRMTTYSLPCCINARR